MNITRTFHTVGQGAFYSEVFSHRNRKQFVVVYDCGSFSIGSKSLKPKLNRSLETKINSDLESSEVDILFISHFDTDHINGCQFLKPKIVIIPYLSEEQINILSVINTILDGDLEIEILRSPENYFQDSHIIRIYPAEEGGIQDNQEFRILDIDSDNVVNPLSGIKNIPSGTSLRVDSLKELWEYIPYNPNWSKFFQSFKDAVYKDDKLEYDKLNTADNGGYVINNIERLRDIYNSLKYKNNHSLIVYSGPLNPIDALRPFIPGIMDHSHYNWCWSGRISYPRIEAGCIYYGDITISDDWHGTFLKLLGNHRIDCIGTVQIPHHGASSGCGDLGLVNDSRLCVISVGNKNTYGHPSAHILSSIIQKFGIPCLVTEHSSTVVIQSYRFRHTDSLIRKRSHAPISPR